MASQTSYTDAFLATATDDVKVLFNQKMQDESIKEVEKFLIHRISKSH